MSKPNEIGIENQHSAKPVLDFRDQSSWFTGDSMGDLCGLPMYQYTLEHGVRLLSVWQNELYLLTCYGIVMFKNVKQEMHVSNTPHHI